MKMWSEVKTQKQWKEELQKLLKENDKALMKSVIAIYHLQTSAEKHRQETLEHNGVGFTGPDAKVMTKIALGLLYKKGLTQSQVETARYRMPKYWKQLMMLSKKKLADELTPKEIAKTDRKIPDNLIMSDDAKGVGVQMEMDLR